ncbi:HIT family protein [Paenibacillus eucommiae]|uniref:Diadenosine tetraphosphate (Ap4A) HIT family hydrolase n=1 Tax=Paenibacillus eucommiae TaxID=1355755 RepID=A0ABS4IMP7_9BACL|nr:HIT domain-containing protein [Paenibacillus eucommiae]MBP1988836.1 diadenosine tetraphosphate (Ap4A) HIT family hydrolase [Paenibacillus eucommiae]
MKEICKLQVSTVYLNNEQEYQGRCTVVLNAHKTELFQLEDEERNQYMSDVAKVAEALKEEFAAEKINYAGVRRSRFAYPFSRCTQNQVSP